MNFSKYKLQNYLNEGVTNERGATASITSSVGGTERSKLGAQNALEKKQMGTARQRAQSTHKSAQLTRMGSTMEHLDQIQRNKELIKAYESNKSDWRSELNEKVMDGQERENHPFVTVMPTGDENLIQAMKQMGKGIKDKKDQMQGQMKENVQNLEEKKGLWDNINAKKKKGKPPAKKGDENYPETLNIEGYEETKKTEVLGALSKKKSDFKKRYGKNAPDVMHAVAAKTAANKGDTSKSDDRYAYEETIQPDSEELEEAKKKKGCKDGYYRDEDGDCVKKKKKKSGTTIIMGRGWGYGGHHHDHDDDGDNGDGGDGDGGGGDGGGGGMGEMFDLLGDMLLQEKEMTLRDAQKAGVTKGNPFTPPNHRKLNAQRVKNYVAPKTTNKERAKD